MSFIRGLAAVKEEVAKRPSGGGDYEDRPKAVYVKVEDGESQKLVPLQEIDEGSPNYSEKNGLALFALMHSNPDNWRKSAKCTTDESFCVGCDRGWNQKMLLFINVLIDDGKNEPYVAIWNKGVGKGSAAQTLINIAGDEDYDYSVTDKTYKLSRTGTKKDTVYNLNPLPKPHKLDLESYELFDLEKYVFYVKPEKQEAYYFDAAEGTPDPKPSQPVSSSAIDQEW